jgi:hypothetical protein
MKTKIIGAPKGAPLEFFSGSKRHGFRSHENENERRTLTVKLGRKLCSLETYHMAGFWVAGGQEADTKGNMLIKTGH